MSNIKKGDDYIKVKDVVAQVTYLPTNKTFKYIVRNIKYDFKSETIWIIDHRNHYLDFDMNEYKIVLTKGE